MGGGSCEWARRNMDVLIDLVWLFIGSLLSVVLVIAYDILFFKKFDLQDAILHQNVSASVFFGLMVLGVGLVVFAVILSPGTRSLTDDLVQTVAWSVGVTFIATILFYLCDKLFLPKMSLEDEIKKGNVAAGIFSGLLYIVVSLIGVAVILS
jgi:uncharacterized membrane protein YjfL (UPF0719 family)